MNADLIGLSTDYSAWLRSVAGRGTCFRNATAPVAVPTPSTTAPEQGVIPFRRATVEKVNMLTGESLALTTALQRISRKVDGNGFIYGVVLDVQAPTAANVAATTFTEDAPWNALDSVVLSDAAGELVNLAGYDLFVANLCTKQYAWRFQDSSAYLFNLTPGAGADGGTFRFAVRVPVGLGRRSLTGMVGNQDRGTSYTLRSDLAASTTIYTTAPTALPTVSIDKYYEFYTLPADVVTINGRRQAQQQYPDDYGRLHFITAYNFQTAPAPSGTQQFYLQRIGNSIRYVALIFRAGAGATPRALAEANMPTACDFQIGDDTIFHETVRYRRWLMYERFGFDFPSGVLVYDAEHDLLAGAGSEVGDDYYYTQGLNNARFQFVFPAGFTAGGSLHAITDDLQEVEAAA